MHHFQEADLFSLGEWIELANGCLCCSVKDDFLRALEALVEQRHKFDYVLIETTGEICGQMHSLTCRTSGVEAEGRAVEEQALQTLGQ